MSASSGRGDFIRKPKNEQKHTKNDEKRSNAQLPIEIRVNFGFLSARQKDLSVLIGAQVNSAPPPSIGPAPQFHRFQFSPNPPLDGDGPPEDGSQLFRNNDPVVVLGMPYSARSVS